MGLPYSTGIQGARSQMSDPRNLSDTSGTDRPGAVPDIAITGHSVGMAAVIAALG